MKIAENKEEIIRQGKILAEQYPEHFKKWYDYSLEIVEYLGGDVDHIIESFYLDFYFELVYGSDFAEGSGYHFKTKSHKEKMEYLTHYNRTPYIRLLNRQADVHLLKNKFETYTLLKPYYKREAMLLKDENDFETFKEFAEKHKSLFIKPNSLQQAIGAHPLKIKENDDLRDIFNSLLKEAKDLAREYPNASDANLIIEEEIISSKVLEKVSPIEMPSFRVCTLLKGNEVILFHPFLKAMFGDGVEHKGEEYSFCAAIDEKTGVIIGNGINSLNEYKRHPLTNAPIKGLQIPEWQDLKTMLTTAAKKLPTIRYIGWDVTYSERGWCIVEGNEFPTTATQMCIGRGLKKEFEQITGIHIPFNIHMFRGEYLVLVIGNHFFRLPGIRFKKKLVQVFYSIHDFFKKRH